MTESAPREDDILAEFDRRMQALLADLKGRGISGRVLLYLDIRRGQVVNGGVVKEKAERWV